MPRSVFTLLMLGILCASRAANAVTLIQGFNQATIPTGWTISNATPVAYVTDSTSPVAEPYEGTHFVRFGAASGTKAQLISPAMSTVGKTNTQVVFALFGIVGTLLDGVTLQYSTDGVAWKNVATYYRKDIPAGWNLITCNYPASTTNQPTLYIAFEFVSASANGLCMDYVRVLNAQVSPPTSLIAVAITNLSASQIDLAWQANAAADAVVIATNATFGEPIDGTSYAVGAALPGGGGVIYQGSASAYTCYYQPDTRYYYSAWSVNTATIYSAAVTNNAQTLAAMTTITNVTANQLEANLSYVEISYDLLNPAGGSNYVLVQVSTNSGATYVVDNSTNMTGDVGLGVSTGMHKQVEWFARYTGGDLPAGNFPHTRVRVTADNDMVYIPAGAFLMGSNSFADGLGNDPTDAAPRHTVTNSAYWMDKYEVTSQQWMNVYNWGTARGYSFTTVDVGTKAPQHPVQYLTWYACVTWCNARSQKEGLTPCYYTDAAKTILYTNTSRQGALDLANDRVNWNANGYRLPTEAEWEKAARGGAVAMRFPWSDAYTITNARANYLGDKTYKYDMGPTGYNPTFNDGISPYTSPAGYFAPNGYGLYDMAGNVFEWCWDWYASYSSATVTDPQGPVSGTARVVRGGSCGSVPSYSRVAQRYQLAPSSREDRYGFRCVRRP